MAGLYVDTSALARLMFGEPDSEAVAASLGQFTHHFSSRLLALELRRVALRESVSVLADALLAGVALVPMDDTILAEAETVGPATVATLDAIHLATALALAEAGLLTTVLTYDERLVAGCEANELTPFTPT